MKADTWSFVTSSELLLDVWRLLFTDQIIKNFPCPLWSKDSAEYLFGNMPSSLWNTCPSFWGFKRKLKARPRVSVITSPCCPNQPRYIKPYDAQNNMKRDFDLIKIFIRCKGYPESISDREERSTNFRRGTYPQISFLYNTVLLITFVSFRMKKFLQV